MSAALSIVKIRTRGELPACSNRCNGTHGTRAARFKVAVCGHPWPGEPGMRPGLLCKPCVEELERVWAGVAPGLLAWRYATD